METISHWIAQYGYAGIFTLLLLGIAGLPVPDEWLLTFTGYLIFKGHLRTLPAYFCASLGSMCGITISYGLGRIVGLYVLHRFGRFFRITPEELEKVHVWFDRFGTWTLLVGYYIPGVRHITAIVAGTAKLRFWLFSIFAYSGALIWSATFIGLGYFFGDHWSRVLEKVEQHLEISAWIVVVLVALYVLWRFRKRSRIAKQADSKSDK
jgi:membrane protein DedA with SNARE-associated domain